MISTKRYFDNIAKYINSNNVNILLIGVYLNMDDNLHRVNRELKDTKSFYLIVRKMIIPFFITSLVNPKLSW